MEQKIVYRELLSEITKLADAKGGSISRKEVDEFFAHTGLEEEHMTMICEYLVSQGIKVDGFTSTASGQEMFRTEPEEEENELQEAAEKEADGSFEFDEDDDIKTDGELEDNEDEADEASAADVEQKDDSADEEEEYVPGGSILETYLEEIRDLEKLDPHHEMELFNRLIDGDTSARDELIAAYLPTVCELASEYDGKDITSEDLIQEGNIGLIMALDAIEKEESLAAYRTKLLNEVNRYMEEAIGDWKDSRERDTAAARKVNRLNDAIRTLEEDLEHTVSVDELSAFLEMPEAEIRDILKLAGDEINIDDGSAPQKNPWEI